jgi:hypothetical protein
MLHDLAQSAASVIGDELHAEGLRPADYADLESLPKVVVERLIAELKSLPDAFVRTLQDALRMKG